jgi:cytochrome oxidase assembly protein ShyY1
MAADASDPADDPSFSAIAPPELSEGSHLSYAIQWIIFSICVVAGWTLAVRRSIRRARSLPSA